MKTRNSDVPRLWLSPTLRASSSTTQSTPFANPDSNLKKYQSLSSYHLLDIMQEKARIKTSAPLAPSSGPQYLSQSHPGPVSVPAPPPQLKAASPAAPTPGDTTSTPQPTKVTTPQVPYTTSAYVQSSPMPPPQPTTNQFIHQHPQMSPPPLPTAPQQVYTNQVPSEIARRTPTPAQHLPATVAPARPPSRHYAHTLLQPIPQLPQSHGSPQSNAHPPPPPPPLMPQAATPVSHQPSSHPQHHIQQPHLPQQPTRPPSVRSSRTPIPQHHLSQHSMQPPQTRTPVQPPSSQHHSPITNISQHPSPSHQQQPLTVQGHRPPSRLQQTPITSHVHAHATTPRSRPMQGSPSPLHTQQKLGSQHHALSPPPPIPIVRTGGIKREGTPQPYIVSPKSGSVSVPSRPVRTPVPSQQQQQGVIVGGGIQPTPVVGHATLSQVSQNVNVQSQAQGLMGPYQGQQGQLHSHVPNDPAMVIRMKTGGGSVQAGQGTIQSQNPMSVQSQQQQQQQQQLQQLMYQKALMTKNGRTGTPGIGQQQQQLPPGMMRVNPMIMNAVVRSGTGQQQQQQGQGGNGYSQQQLMALQQQFLRAQAAQAQVRGLNMDQMKVLQAQVHAQQAQLAQQQQHHHHQQQQQQQQQQLFLQQQQQHHSVIQSNTQQQRGGRTGTPGNNLSSSQQQQQQQQYYIQQMEYNINMQNAQVASAAAAAVVA